MAFQNMSIKLNKDKAIGKVLYIVEGGKTEAYILYQIFCKILDYQMETILRDKKYHKYNSKENPNSQVFVINAEESNIKNIAKDNKFLDNLFIELIENYDFDVDNAAIYYLFDRDIKSNTDQEFIKNILSVLVNSRENEEYYRQGLLLLSYPSIESFTFTNFIDDSFEQKAATGHELKKLLHIRQINQSHISDESLKHATEQLLLAFDFMEINDFNVDCFGVCNKAIFDFQESEYMKTNLYRVLSLLCISLLDLGIIEIL